MDPLDVYPFAHAPDPIAEHQTAGILPESGAEEERFSRKILVRGSFEDDGEYYRGDAEKDKGEDKCGEKREDEYGLCNVI